MTYWLINAIFLAISVGGAFTAAVLVSRGRRVGLSWRSLGITLVVVLLMTAIFDNVMIGVGLVGYDPARISGVFVGIAPLEDFAYAVAAVILLPSMWIILGQRMSPHPVTPAHLAASSRDSAS